MSELRSRRIRVLGLGLPVLEAGAADKDEAVIFLHGHPGSSMDWKAYLPRVAEFGRAVAFDLPGLGKADKPRSWDYTIGTYASKSWASAVPIS
jgi:pimeloyl-ACP methyl ester carboxylesterase